MLEFCYELRLILLLHISVTLQGPISTYKFSSLSPYTSLENKLGEFDNISKHSPFDDHFTNSYNLFYWFCMNIVRRKMTLVTIGSWRVKWFKMSNMGNESIKKISEEKSRAANNATDRKNNGKWINLTLEITMIWNDNDDFQPWRLGIQRARCKGFTNFLRISSLECNHSDSLLLSRVK